MLYIFNQLAAQEDLVASAAGRQRLALLPAPRDHVGRADLAVPERADKPKQLEARAVAV